MAENFPERQSLGGESGSQALPPHLLSGVHAGQDHQWGKVGGCQVVLFLFLPALLQLLLLSMFPPLILSRLFQRCGGQGPKVPEGG